MNRNILKIMSLSCILLATGCNEGIEDLLGDGSLYFERINNTVEIEGDSDEMTIEVSARLSALAQEDIDVTYSIVSDQSVIDAYNRKNGTEYVAFTSASIGSGSSKVAKGEVLADAVEIRLTGVSGIEPGVTPVLPVKMTSSSAHVIEGSDIIYFVLKAPVKITTAGLFELGNKFNTIQVPIKSDDSFSEITYEALFRQDQYDNSKLNSTIMGVEGLLILRIGDAKEGTTPRDVLQVSGNAMGDILLKDDPIELGKWYHVALSCNGSTGILYLNGVEKVRAPIKMPADFTGGGNPGFRIAGLENFKWGARPFYGCMSEVRIWNVARTADQIRENMLNVKPDTDGLVYYYKLNREDGKVFNEVTGEEEAHYRNVSAVELETPIVIQ